MFEKKINLLLDKIDLIGNEQYKNLRELAWKFSVAKGMIVRSIKNVNNAERLVASIILLTYSLS